MLLSQKTLNIQYPKYYMLTVPHSGTRYVVDSFRRCGLNVGHVYTKELLTRKNFHFAWAHLTKGHWDREVGMICSNIEKPFITCRDPSLVFATHMEEVFNKVDTNGKRQVWVNNKLYKLSKCWEAQSNLGFFTFRVDRDPIQRLSEWAGIALRPDDERYSLGSYPWKEAIKNRDLERIRELEEGTNVWEPFCELSTEYADWYKDKGYDLWWLDG